MRAVRRSSAKIDPNKKPFAGVSLPSSVKRSYYVTILCLIILSVISISLEADKLNGGDWSFSADISVSSVTLLLILFFWLPILFPLILKQFPQLQGSLDWLRGQGIEEIETNLLRIKLRYDLKEASEQYEKKIANAQSTSELVSQEIRQSNEIRYREAISAINTRSSNITPSEALSRIDQLATYYDRLRQDMPSSSNRTRLMGDIASVMWSLVPQTNNFPVRQRLNSREEGQRLSAYKYIEWYPSDEYIDLLLSRAIGILEVPFGQYGALLALRRVLATTEISLIESQRMKEILCWAVKLDYISPDTGRSRLMLEISSLLSGIVEKDDTSASEN